MVMRLRHDHFRSHVLERTAERMPRRVVTLLCFLGHSAVVLHAPAKVAYLQIAIGVHQQVAGLQVAVQDATGVQVLEAAQDLVNEELDVLVREGLVGLDDLTQVRLHQFGNNVDLVEFLQRLWL